MDRKRVIKLRDEWVEVDPSSWSDKMDATVSVALGHGNKDQQVMQLNNLVQMAAQNSDSPMISPDNLYNITSSLLKAMGYQNVNDYITPPQQQKPEKPDPLQQATLKAMEVEDQVKQGELEVKRMKAENEIEETKLDAQFKMVEMEMEADRDAPVKIG